ncbi:MAG: AMP-binding protein [Endozoicomonas sp.]|uniref:AMP-binding protein n=1 Tax=Endozoicomonas sp. TaxID=1892382 RepID=UPI003D9B68D6
MSDDINNYPLMPHLIIDGLNQHDDRPCLHLGESIATYKTVREKSSQFHQVLASKGIGIGSRVAILSGNRPEVLYNLCAMSIAGSCGTALHPLGSKDDHAYVMNDAEIETLVYDASLFEERAKELKEIVPSLKNLLAFGDTQAGENYTALSEQFEPQPLKAPDISPEDLNAIVYTGGTTGKPKGVLQPYRVPAAMTQAIMAEWDLPKDLRMLIATPLSHAGAAFLVPTLQRGGTIFAPAYFTPDLVFDTIEKYKINATFMVPVMLYMLLDHPRSETADLSSLDIIYYGASPMSPSRLEEGINKWGQKFFQVYGQSEAPMVLSHLKREDHDLSKPERLGSAGKPSPWVHLELLDKDNNPVAPGEPGEICVRSPLVMTGYYKQPEQTKEAMAGGWLHTGDVGRFDEDGFLYIVDRTKDMIVTGGFNVFPKEVENVLSAQPSVAQVAVIGVPDDHWGESVKAVVVLRPGVEKTEELTEGLINAVKDAKGSVQAPKTIDYVEALQLTPVGKPDKKAIRAQYWDGQERAVK